MFLTAIAETVVLIFYKACFDLYITRPGHESNALPRIDIGADVWGESSIMTGVY